MKENIIVQTTRILDSQFYASKPLIFLPFEKQENEKWVRSWINWRHGKTPQPAGFKRKLSKSKLWKNEAAHGNKKGERLILTNIAFLRKLEA